MLRGPVCTGLDDDDGASAARLGTAVLDLVTVLFAARLRQDSSVSPPARQRALLTSIHAHIEAELGDPGLTPASIAAAHHISVRYLHKLFEPEGRSVAALIRQRRLDRCRRDLIDPVLAARPVAATAARWGFVSVPHFHRLFRDAYGLPPAEFRAVHADLAKGQRPGAPPGSVRAWAVGVRLAAGTSRAPGTTLDMDAEAPCGRSSDESAGA